MIGVYENRLAQDVFLAHLYESTGRAFVLHPASVLALASTKMLKFYVKFLRPHIF